MAEGCEKASHLLNPATPVLAPCMRHTQQPQSQEPCEDVHMFLDRDLSLCREGKCVKGEKIALSGNGTSLVSAHF